MVAGADACYCAQCGVKCNAKFQACRDVWKGKPPVPDHFVERSALTGSDSAGPRSAGAEPASGAAVPLAPAPPLETAAPIAESPALASDSVSNEAIAAMLATMSELGGRVDRLGGVVERLVGQQETESGRQTDVLASIGWVKSEISRIEKGAAEFESATRQLLDRHRDAIRRLGTRVKKLEQPSPPT